MSSSLDFATNPYVGPRTFSYEQRRLFFGREREARDLLARVISERLLLFYAQSGAGKSSLLHTRLIPQLRQEEGCLVLPVGRVSGELPQGVAAVDNLYLFNLMTSLDMSEVDPVRLAQLSLCDFLARLASEDGERWSYDPTLAVSAESDPALGASQRYVLIIDQFEEIITTHPNRWREREGFFRQLNEAMQVDPNLWVVLTLREDYVAALDPYAQFMADKLRARFYMERMNLRAALDAICQPAALGRRPFAPRVAEALVDNLRRIKVVGQESEQLGQYVEPVQLQIVCFQLWERLKARPPAPISADDLQQSGDVDSALATFYEEAITAVLRQMKGKVSERQLRLWFEEELITEAGTRGTVYRGDNETANLPNQAVDLLQGQFLLRSEPRAGSAWVELVHDRFVEPVLASNRRWRISYHNPLMAAAELWDSADRTPEKLLSGAKLDEARTFAQQFPQELSPLEQALLDESLLQEERQEAEARNRRRRNRLLLIGGLSLIVLFALLSGYGLNQAAQARKAQKEAEANQQQAETQRGLAVGAQATAVANQQLADSRARQALEAEERASTERAAAVAARERSEQIRTSFDLAARSLTALETGQDIELSLLLAVESARAAASADAIVPQVDNALRRALALAPSAIVHQAPGATELFFNTDGSRLATLDENDSVRLWDLSAGQVLTTVVVTSMVSSLSFSADGSKLILPRYEQPPLLVDAKHGEALTLGNNALISVTRVSPDGCCLFTAVQDHGLAGEVWDLSRGERLARFPLSDTTAIESVTISPDGTHLTFEDHGELMLWEVRSGTRQSLREDIESVSAIHFSPDSRHLVIGDDHALQLWDIASTTLITNVVGWSTYDDFAFSPDGSRLAIASEQGLLLLDTTNGAQLIRSQPDHPVSRLVFSRDSAQLIASADREIRLWDARSGESRARLPLEAGGGVDFSPDGAHLATINSEAVKVWELPGTTPIATLPGGEQLWFSPTGDRLAIEHEDRTVELWQFAADGKLEPIVTLHHVGEIQATGFSPDGASFASASDDGAILSWAARADPEPVLITPSPGQTIKVVGESSFVTLDGENKVRLVNVISNQVEATFPQDGAVGSLALSPKGDLLAVASLDGQVRLWNVVTGAEVATFQAEESPALGDPTPLQLSFSHDGTRLVTMRSGSGNTRFWETQSGRMQSELGFDNEPRLSPDGQRIAVVYQDPIIYFAGGVALVDSATGNELAKREINTGRGGSFALTAEFVAGGAALAISTAEQLFRRDCCHLDLLDSTNGEQKARVALEGWPLDMTANPAGNRLAITQWRPSAQTGAYFTNDNHRMVELWAVEDWDHVEPLALLDIMVDNQAESDNSIWEGPLNGLYSMQANITFSRNGEFMAIVGENNVVYVVNSKTGEQLTLLPHTGELAYALFTPDNEWLITCCADGKLRRWRLGVESLVALACKILAAT